MAYKLIITERADELLDNLIHHLIYRLKNEQAARHLLDGININEHQGHIHNPAPIHFEKTVKSSGKQKKIYNINSQYLSNKSVPELNISCLVPGTLIILAFPGLL